MAFKMRGFKYPGNNESPLKARQQKMGAGDRVIDGELCDAFGNPKPKQMKENIGKMTDTPDFTKKKDPAKGLNIENSEDSPLQNHVDGKPHWKTKAKYRKDGTLKKVVTKAKRGSGNKESRSVLQGVFGKNNYKSTIKFDEDGRIKSAKNNRTANKNKKKVQRLSKSKWVERDLTPYHTDSTPIKPKKKKKYNPEKDPDAATWKKTVAMNKNK